MWCARRRATTRRASRWPAGRWEFTAACTCRPRRRNRNATASAITAGSSSSSSSAARPTTWPPKLRSSDVARTGATLVPPYDDVRTMAGQGTIAVEILDQLDAEPDLVVVPVGGGGCISGITSYLADRTTGTSVLGVEPAGAAAMVAALAEGAPVTLDHVDQFVDGAAVARVGALPFAALVGRRGHGVDHHGRRGRGVHRDARPVPERGNHRRARGRACRWRACSRADVERRAPRWCA